MPPVRPVAPPRYPMPLQGRPRMLTVLQARLFEDWEVDSLDAGSDIDIRLDQMCLILHGPGLLVSRQRQSTCPPWSHQTILLASCSSSHPRARPGASTPTVSPNPMCSRCLRTVHGAFPALNPCHVHSLQTLESGLLLQAIAQQALIQHAEW
jgi:hypothetical protein